MPFDKFLTYLSSRGGIILSDHSFFAEQSQISVDELGEIMMYERWHQSWDDVPWIWRVKYWQNDDMIMITSPTDVRWRWWSFSSVKPYPFLSQSVISYFPSVKFPVVKTTTKPLWSSYPTLKINKSRISLYYCKVKCCKDDIGQT